MFGSKASSVIKNGRKLMYEYVPKKIMHRDEQTKRLEMLFRPMFEDNVPVTALLSGPVGSGKTVTMKHFCQEMEAYGRTVDKNIKSIFINCRTYNTEASVMLQLVKFFDKGYPERGLSPGEMTRSFRAHVIKNAMPLVVVFDEVDILIKKNTIDLIYQLTRFTEDRTDEIPPVSLVLISQDYIFDDLDAASQSSFRRTNTVRFDRYNREELYEITEARAEEALHENTLDKDVLSLIADIAQEYGDARFAIELLDRAAHFAEERPEGLVISDDVRAAKAMTYSVVTEDKLEVLDDNRKVVLLAIARAIKKQTYTTTGEVEKLYYIACEEYNVPKRKHTQFWQYIQDLEKSDLIKIIVRGDTEDNGGRTTFISLPDIPSKVLARKIEDILDYKTDHFYTHEV